MIDTDTDKLNVFSTLSGDPEDILTHYPDIKVMARNRYKRPEETEDAVSEIFVLRATNGENQCLAFSQHTFWSGIAQGFHSDGLSDHAMMARRLTTQIVKTLRRFEKLSNSYRIAIAAADAAPSEGISFVQNKYASNVGHEFGSFLDDLYALRDAINAIIHKIHLKADVSFSTKNFKKKLETAPVSALTKMIQGSMFDPTAGDLIVSHMSTYRAVAIHSLGTSNPVSGDSLVTKFADGPIGRVSWLVYPLYDDMEKLKEIEFGASGSVFEKMEFEEFKRFATLEKHIDAMDFGYRCFVRLLQTADLLGSELGMTPRHLTITDKDILSAEFRDEDGNRKRLHRDGLTGELVERD